MPFSYIKYAAGALVILMIAALTGWYLFLKQGQTAIEEIDAGRGAGTDAPFGSALGNTYENIVSSFSTLVGGSVQSDERGLPRLAQVGKTPTAGHNFIEKGAKNRLRFVERGSGHIFDVAPETGVLERVTNTLVPHTYEARIAGDHVVMRGLEEGGAITTTLSEVAASTSTQKEPSALKQRPFAKNIREIALSADGNTLVYVVETGVGGSGFRSSWDVKSEKQIFSSAIVGWQIDVLDNGQIMATQNAEDGVVGHTYRAEDGTLKPVVEGVLGLTFLPHPALSAYLYGESAGSGPSLFARMSGTTSLTTLPVRTIAEKCVFAPKELVAYCAVPQQLPPADFLGRWYRGEIHTSDAWWKIDLRANAAESLYSATNATFDVENPTIDPSGSYIAFRNAADKTLWLLRIEE